MCTSSNDGLVKFWNTSALVAQNEDSLIAEPNTLHHWFPHDQAPVSSIKFLDNHLENSTDVPFWRFLLTGAKINTELKIWCTVKWQCLQTISFVGSPMPPPEMKLNCDQSGAFIMMTDIHRRVVYAFECFTSFEDEGKFDIIEISARNHRSCTAIPQKFESNCQNNIRKLLSP